MSYLEANIESRKLITWSFAFIFVPPIIIFLFASFISAATDEIISIGPGHSGIQFYEFFKNTLYTISAGLFLWSVIRIYKLNNEHKMISNALMIFILLLAVGNIVKVLIAWATLAYSSSSWIPNFSWGYTSGMLMIIYFILLGYVVSFAIFISLAIALSRVNQNIRKNS